MAGGIPAFILASGLAFVLLSSAISEDEGFVRFGYSRNATANWCNLSPAYKTCCTGTHQSPIKINKGHVDINTKLHHLDRIYMDANATLINNGFNVMLKFDSNVGYLSQDGKNYALKQLHWHTPSEHIIDEKRFPLELHLVHMSDDGNISVIGILYNLGKSDPFIYQLKDVVAKLAKEHASGDEKSQLPVGLVRTKSLKLHTRKYFKYAGSFTTPPCTENVTWYILGKVRKVSKEQVALLRSPLAQEFKNNARPTQQLNRRVVLLYDEQKFSPHSN